MRALTDKLLRLALQLLARLAAWLAAGLAARAAIGDAAAAAAAASAPGAGPLPDAPAPLEPVRAALSRQKFRASGMTHRVILPSMLTRKCVGALST